MTTTDKIMELADTYGCCCVDVGASDGDDKACAAADIASAKLKAAIEALVADRDALITWLNNNTTFYDVDRTCSTKFQNVPVLASVSKRIWYHATDNQLDYPFSQVVRSAMKESV